MLADLILFLQESQTLKAMFNFNENQKKNLGEEMGIIF